MFLSSVSESFFPGGFDSSKEDPLRLSVSSNEFDKNKSYVAL